MAEARWLWRRKWGEAGSGLKCSASSSGSHFASGIGGREDAQPSAFPCPSCLLNLSPGKWHFPKRHIQRQLRCYLEPWWQDLRCQDQANEPMDRQGRFQELGLREGYLSLCMSRKPGHLASLQTIFVSDKGVSCLTCWKIP